MIELLEKITLENIWDLKPGDWIWDNSMIVRNEHRRTLNPNKICEAVGFRQIHILDLDDFFKWGAMPFHLTTIDDCSFCREWVHFELDRFYKFKKEKEL